MSLRQVNLLNKDDLKMKSAGKIPVRIWNAMIDLIWSLAVTSTGDGLLLQRNITGTSIGIKRVPGGGGGGSAADCPLGDMLVDAENSTTVIQKFKIRSGYVHGGGSSKLALEEDVNDLEAIIGDKVFLKIEFSAEESNGVLFGSGSIESVVVEQAAEVPDDDEYDGENAVLHHYRLLGEWISNEAEPPAEVLPVWIKDGCGSYSFEFCGGMFVGGFRGGEG